jgi:hypothetical protein
VGGLQWAVSSSKLGPSLLGTHEDSENQKELSVPWQSSELEHDANPVRHCEAHEKNSKNQK